MYRPYIWSKRQNVALACVARWGPGEGSWVLTPLHAAPTLCTPHLESSFHSARSVGTMYIVDCGGCLGQSDGDRRGTGTQLWGWQNNQSSSSEPGVRALGRRRGRVRSRGKMEKPKAQAESGRREGQRTRDGQGRVRNNKRLVEPRAAELGLGSQPQSLSRSRWASGL